MTGRPLVREPRQARSRQSFERALDAARDLLVDRGAPSFTLAEVANAAGVSTGSIYGRVASKDDLIRALHRREMSRLDEETRRAFAALPRRDAPAAGRHGAVVSTRGVKGDRGVDEAVVHDAIATLADLLWRHARLLSPFLLIGRSDPVVAAAGIASHSLMSTLLADAMEQAFRAGAAASHAAEERAGREGAVTWACAVTWSVLARQLSVGSDPGAAAAIELDEVVDRLARMLARYLEDPVPGETVITPTDAGHR